MDLVGVAYKDTGLTPEEGLDCYGLVRWVLNQELNLDLPEKPFSPKRWSDYFTIFRERPLPSIQKYDVLLFSNILPGLINHIGVAVSETDFLHTTPALGGVVLVPINYHQDRVTAIGRPRQ
jgi:cell wall-associated NlpC family hydrolase